MTIMLNYVAIYLLQWSLTTSQFERPGREDPISPVVDPNAQYPQIGDTRLHTGFLLALLARGLRLVAAEPVDGRLRAARGRRRPDASGPRG